MFSSSRCSFVVPRSGNVLDGHVWIDSVLVEEVDHIDLEPLERRLGDLLDVRWLAVQAPLAAGFELEAELCGDHHSIAERGERLAHELFVRERAVRISEIISFVSAAGP